jgi:hypothetical protein
MGEQRPAERRARFDHLAAELSLAVGALVPRWPLWMRLHELDQDPEDLSAEAVVAFCGGPARSFLADHGLALSWNARRRLIRSVQRFDPANVTPEQVLGLAEPDDA